MMLQRQEFPLETASVDLVSDKIAAFLTDAEVDRKLIVQNRLFAEEILNSWIDAGIADVFNLVMGRRFGRPVIYLEASGLPYNVFEQQDSGSAFLLKSLLNSLGKYPTYSYVNGKNLIQLNFPPKKKNKLLQIVLAIALAVAAGLLVCLVFPEIKEVLLTDLINPLYSAAFRLLGFISGPLIFLSVMWGIYGIGDASTLNLVGKKIISRFLVTIFVIAFASCLTFPVFGFEFQSSDEGSSSFKTIFEMILDIIPPNIAEPFVTGNTLHIIFCAVVFGIAMLFLGKRVTTVASVVEEINCIVQFLMAFISSLMPCFVFLVVLRLILSDALSTVSSVWKLFVMFLAAVIVLCGAFTLEVSVRHRVSPVTLIRKSIPTFIIAITTASSAAAFSSNMYTCVNRFGIDRSICSFGIPLGMVMYKTATTAYYVLVSFFFASLFRVAVSPEWILSDAFLSAMLAIATPPIPGGGVIAYTMLFGRLGVPDEALAIVLSIDILFDFIRTSANMYNLPLALIDISSTMGKLDLDILRDCSSLDHQGSLIKNG